MNFTSPTIKLTARVTLWLHLHWINHSSPPPVSHRTVLAETVLPHYIALSQMNGQQNGTGKMVITKLAIVIGRYIFFFFRPGLYNIPIPKPLAVIEISLVEQVSQNWETLQCPIPWKRSVFFRILRIRFNPRFDYVISVTAARHVCKLLIAIFNFATINSV